MRDDQTLVRQTLGQRIRRLRNQLGVSQLEFATALHWNQATVSDIERGHREVKVTEVGRIARQLEVTVEDLVKALGFIGEDVTVRVVGAVAVATAPPPSVRVS